MSIALACEVQAPDGSCEQLGAGSLVYTQELLPLNNHAGSQPSGCLEVTDPETGEVTEFPLPLTPGFNRPKYTVLDHQNARADRWKMKWALDDLLPGSRQYKCHRWKIPNKDLELKLSIQHEKSFFAGFECCGSVWGCPLCAPKITERRRVEVQGAIEKAKEMGLSVMLGTFTIPHGLGDDVKHVLAMMKKAWIRTSSGKKAKAVRQTCGFRGSIRVLEVTYGHNGWHPHFHVLFFLDTKHSPSVIEAIWYQLWRSCCLSVGLGEPSSEHGVRVDDGSWAARYVSKWGLESELTKGHLKRGKSSVSPWDLLRFHSGVSVSSEVRSVFSLLGIDAAKAGSLFLVFFSAFKGSRQLYWSNGLRDFLGLADEKTDQALAEEELDTAALLLATITDEQRFALVRRKKLPELLTLAEDFPGLVMDFLDSISGARSANERTEPPEGARPSGWPINYSEVEQ